MQSNKYHKSSSANLFYWTNSGWVDDMKTVLNFSSASNRVIHANIRQNFWSIHYTWRFVDGAMAKFAVLTNYYNYNEVKYIFISSKFLLSWFYVFYYLLFKIYIDAVKIYFFYTLIVLLFWKILALLTGWCVNGSKIEINWDKNSTSQAQFSIFLDKIWPIHLQVKWVNGQIEAIDWDKERVHKWGCQS